MRGFFVLRLVICSHLVMMASAQTFVSVVLDPVHLATVFSRVWQDFVLVFVDPLQSNVRVGDNANS